MSTPISPMKVCNDLELLHPYTKACAIKVLERCEKEGLSVGAFETLRTLERQKYLVSTKNSTTLLSYHRLGLAVDFVFKTAKGNWTWERPKEDWDKLAKIMDDCGFSPGWYWKKFKDGPHGQIDFEGVRSTTLYAKLDASENIEDFYALVNELILNDKYHSKNLAKVSMDVVAVQAPNLVVTTTTKQSEATQVVVSEASAEPTKESLIANIIKFILSLLGVK